MRYRSWYIGKMDISWTLWNWVKESKLKVFKATMVQALVDGGKVKVLAEGAHGRVERL